MLCRGHHTNLAGTHMRIYTGFYLLLTESRLVDICC
jgi:hypothetical protein